MKKIGIILGICLLTALSCNQASEQKENTMENAVIEIQNHYILLENVTLDTENSKFIDVIDADISPIQQILNLTSNP